MLDTGIDVPEVVNLVLFKLIRSKTKFWQILGRGTRLCEDLFGPGLDKECFYVFDFCQNLEFFSQNPAVTEAPAGKGLSERLFEARLDLVLRAQRARTRRQRLAELAEEAEDVHARRRRARCARRRGSSCKDQTLALLRDYVAGMNLDNFVVRPHRRVVEKFQQRSSLDRHRRRRAARAGRRGRTAPLRAPARHRARQALRPADAQPAACAAQAAARASTAIASSCC